MTSINTYIETFINILSHSLVTFMLNVATSVLVDATLVLVDATSVKMDSDNDNRLGKDQYFLIEKNRWTK